MRLNDLHPHPRSTKKRKRVGRGPGSGHGKTSTRGHKGHKARSGGSTPPGYEGGQMPLIRRIPKRGFTPVHKTVYSVVNLKDLSRFQQGAVVDPQALRDAGLVKGKDPQVKILGMGELKAALTVKAHKFSASAKSRIEAAGGKVEAL